MATVGKSLEERRVLGAQKNGKISSVAAKARSVQRASLTGKFPNLKHYPAPAAKLKIDAETRKRMVGAMLDLWRSD